MEYIRQLSDFSSSGSFKRFQVVKLWRQVRMKDFRYRHTAVLDREKHVLC